MIVVTVTSSEAECKSEIRRFTGPTIRIGREPDNDLVLDCKSCSRYHAEIRSDNGGYRITDLGSTNGVKVAGEKVNELQLRDGGSVTVGSFTLSFSIPAASAERTRAITLDPTLAMSDETARIQPPPVPERKAVLFLVYRIRGQDQSFTVASGIEYVIGRSPAADLRLDDRNVSARHAMLFSRGDRFFCKDLGSANGTLVNDSRIEDEVELRPGDRCAIGQTVLTVSRKRPALADSELLMARTQHRIPTQGNGRESIGSGSRMGALVLGLGAVVLAVVIGVVLLRQGPGEVTGPQPGSGPQPGVTEVPGSSGSEMIVRVATITEQELVLGVSGAGSIRPQQSVTVSSEVPARVVDVAVEEGATVSKGQLLVRLDDHDLQLRIEEARSSVSSEQVELAREDFERKERLLNEGAVTRSVYDQARSRYLQLDSAYRSVQVKIRQLREQVSKTRIQAPAAGTVVRKLVSAGEVVGPGAPVLVIENMEEVLAEVEISDRDIVKVRPLQIVEARSDAFPGRIFHGVVENVGSTANPVSRAFKVEARIGNQDGLLRSGMIASITIVLEKRSGLVVPAEALLNEHGDEAEVLLVEDGIAKRVRVTLGQRMEREAELLKGLSAGDEVVIYGHDKLSDGQPVKTF